MRTFHYGLLLALFAAPGFADAVVVRVGAVGDPACDAFSLPGAIARLPADSASHRILLSAGPRYDAGGTISARNVAIEGGYANCSAAAPQSGVRSEVGPVPTATAALLVVRGTGTAVSVTVRNVDWVGPAPGGLLSAEGSVTLTLDDADASGGGGSALAAGGGVQVLAGARLVLRGRTEVYGNQAEIGGGVRCNSADLHIAGSDVLIAGNRAVAGGGVALDNCILDWDPDNQSTQGGINGNQALFGGGVYAIDSLVRASTAGSQPLGPRRVLANAAGIGGGLYLDNVDLALPRIDVSSNRTNDPNSPSGLGHCAGLIAYTSDLELGHYRIEGNVARFDGGGVCLVDDAALFDLPAPACVDGACRSIANNRAGGDGGALLLADDSFAVLARLRITANHAASGTAVHAVESPASDSGSLVVLTNALVAGNTAFAGTLFALGAGDLDLTATTIAANATTQALIGDDGNSTIDLAATLINAPTATPTFDVTPTTAVRSQCVIAHERASFVQQGADARVAAPGFIDAGGGNYRLRADSVALDACAPALKDPLLVDISGAPRPVDLPASNGNGPWDIGAWERALDDTIFASGFE